LRFQPEERAPIALVDALDVIDKCGHSAES